MTSEGSQPQAARAIGRDLFALLLDTRVSQSSWAGDADNDFGLAQERQIRRGSAAG